ncbi:MAG: hypothetical protein AABN34_08230 [Acidobacteriota bacterium]
MRIARNHYRACLSGLLSLMLAATFSLSSFAAAGVTNPTDEAITDSLLVSQAPTGTLTAHGPVLVNGNEAKTGATITDGSVIQTRTGGHAIIELGAPGRVELDPITAITLTMTSNSIHATLDKCGQGVTLVLPAGVTGLVKILNISDVGVLKKDREVDVKVFKGEALVKYGQGKEKIVKAGDHKEFDNAIEVTATGDAVVKVYCIEDHYPLLLWGALAAIAIPIREAISDPVIPILSPITP